MDRIELVIDGKPVGKGRPRFTRTGRAYTPKTTHDYENYVQKIYKKLYASGFDGNVPLAMIIKAFYPVPTSGKKAERQAKLDGLVAPYNVKPDIDNVVKIVCDALNGLAFHDDTQICNLRAYKYYAEFPRVEVSIYEVKT